jgi:hypothetical protein
MEVCGQIHALAFILPGKEPQYPGGSVSSIAYMGSFGIEKSLGCTGI